MNGELEILKSVSAPGAVAMVLLWMNMRLNRVESRIEMLATHLGAPEPQKKSGLVGAFAICCAIGLIALTGCAMVNQRVSDADGRTTESHIWALWPATSTADKASAKQTKTTQGIGIEGVTTEGGGTNGLAALAELRGILEAVSKIAP
jgi:hypothetical protein